MKQESLESRMRALEYFHDLKLLPGAWAIVRVDGRSFSRLTSQKFEKPFDVRFHNMMVKTTEALFTELGAAYAYTESDEISLLFAPSWDFCDREVEKIVSLSAGIASAHFALASGVPAHFDSRIWMGATTAQVLDYFHWRMSDASRCALHGWCYWTLRNEGQDARQASKVLEGMTRSGKNELLFERGINYNDLPLWQRRGTGFLWETYQKEGFNPQTGQHTTATRRRVKIDETLPMGDPYRAYLTTLVESC